MEFLSDKWKTDRMKQCTQEELAQRTGLKLETIRNIELGRKKVTPEHPEFKLMCEALNLSPYDYHKKKTTVITFLSNKGGSTKSSSCVNVAFSMAHDYGQKVLVIDTDLQQNCTQHFGVDTNIEKNFYKAFVNNESIEKHIRPTGYENIDIVTGHDLLSILDLEITKIDFREYRVKEILQEIKEKGVYDYICIDCNPSLNSLNTSILFATDGLIVPLNPTAFGKSGMDLIVNFYNNISKRADNLHLLGVLVNKYDVRKRVPRDVVQLVTEQFGESKVLFKTMIPEDANVDKAQMMDTPVAVSFPNTRSVLAFKQLTEEIIKRVERL